MEPTPKKVFCLAGRVAVGKTTIAEHLEAEFDAHHFRTAEVKKQQKK